MTLEKLRAHCLSHAGATEQIQWGADLVFKVGGKMFCVACTEPAPVVMSFKCDDDTFAELVERDGAIPAPYLARAKWVALERFSAITDRELQALVTRAYELVRDKLPRQMVAALSGNPGLPRQAKDKPNQPPTRLRRSADLSTGALAQVEALRAKAEGLSPRVKDKPKPKGKAKKNR